MPELAGTGPVAVRTFVVGIDDSAAAARALRWAVQESRLRGARLVVVHAWDWPYGGELGGLAAEVLAGMHFPEASAKVLAAMVLAALGGDAGGVEVEERVVEGPPAKALVDASAGADLLIVGSRGRGGFGGLLLGSVSQQCLHHAHCPVAVVPSEEQRAA